jgi:hypothetical protein
MEDRLTCKVCGNDEWATVYSAGYYWTCCTVCMDVLAKSTTEREPSEVLADDDEREVVLT